MKILCTTTFLDGRDRFEAGEVRVVEDERAAYFIRHGWARDAGGDGETQTISAGDVAKLDIQSGVIDQEARHG